jgi:hypothetical protein
VSPRLTASAHNHRLAPATPAPCVPKDLSYTVPLRPADHIATMASCDRSETYSEDDNSWHQVPYWSADYGPTDHNTQADAFTQLPIMTPNGSQPHTVEPDPFFGSWGDASLAQVPTQRKAQALAICSCAEELTDTRWKWAISQPMGVRSVERYCNGRKHA